MTYFKIGNTDFSQYVNSLKIEKNANYNAQTNAAGDTVVEYINSKRKIEVGIIPLDEAAAASILSAIDSMNVSISFRNPRTQAIESNVNCIIPDNEIEYYTIQVGKIKVNAFTLSFVEL